VLQLINPHTHIYTLKKGLSNIEMFNEASFKEKYGVDPHQFVDVKALKGDTSDNIPGVGGIGEKTALDLIATYKTLDGVYENLDLLKPAVKAKLEKDRDMAYLSKKLVTLMVDAPIKIDLEHAKLQDGVTPEFAAMLRKLEFKTLLRQVESQLTLEEIKEVETGEAAPELPQAEETAFDEKLFQSSQPRVIALSPDNQKVWISFESKTYAALSLDTLKKLKKTAEVSPVIGHDLKGMFRVLLANDIDPPTTVGHDTRIGAFLLDSLQRSRELDDLLDQPVDKENAGQVSAAIWQAYDDQRVQFNELPKLLKLAQEIEFPMIPLLATIEHRGILLDSKHLVKMSKEFEQKIATIEKEIYKHAGQDFNILSPSQLGMILFEKLGLPTAGVKKGKTGYSTGAAELDKLRGLHPVINLITQYREFTKLKSTYVDALPKLVDKNGRLHTTFALDVAATGRLSSHDPNLQNIPTRTDIGNAIRVAFVPNKGNVFVSADYNQFELRLSAVMAGDQELIDDFNKDVDVHTKTAAEVYGVPMSEVTKLQRRNAKAVNFGIMYGMSPHGLSIATGMNFIEARQFIDKYFELRKPIKQYIDNIVEQGMQDGYVETMFGRRRPTPDLKSSNFMVREGAKRIAMNMPIQGTEADLMKIAMLEVEKVLGGLGEQLLQIHDSILVECPKKNAAKVAEILKTTMENVYKLPVHLKVDVSEGRNWGEL
jgi:DNA polymerase-1